VGRTVLVADDSPSIQNKAKGILTGEGLEVVTVSNGVAAIKKLPTVKPQLVIADVAMPGRDGYEVCEFVKNSPELSFVPVVLVFSDMDPYDEQRGARARADATIKKSPEQRDPFDHEELVAMVAKFLAQAEAAAPKEAPPPPPPPEPEPAPLEPMDEAPGFATPAPSPELEGLEEGVAFGAPMFDESAAPAAEEATEYAAEETAEAPAAGGEGEYYAEPVLIEETEPVAAEPEEPTSERTMIFRAPVEISEPVLSDEVAAEEVAEEAAPPPAEPEEEAAPVDAMSLDSFSLTEATSGHVRFAPGEEVEPGAEEEVAAPPPEAAAPPPAPEEAPAPVEAPPRAAALDADQVFSIVHKVVAKMTPPAFPAQTIEDMARKFTDEILAEGGQ
jgi:CheY-like chemotaxis protein